MIKTWFICIFKESPDIAYRTEADALERGDGVPIEVAPASLLNAYRRRIRELKAENRKLRRMKRNLADMRTNQIVAEAEWITSDREKRRMYP